MKSADRGRYFSDFIQMYGEILSGVTVLIVIAIRKSPMFTNGDCNRNMPFGLAREAVWQMKQSKASLMGVSL